MGMTGEERVFLLMAAGNLLVSAFWLLLSLSAAKAGGQGRDEKISDDRTACLLRFFVMVLCPVAGPLLFFLSDLLDRTVFRFRADLEDVTFCRDRVRTQVHADEERERNLIPAEEAVSVSDRYSLRMAVMNMLKGDMERSLASVALALDAEDAETAHYAAAALSDVLNEFRMHVHRMHRKLQEEGAEDTAEEERMLEYMDPVLRQHVFTEPEQRRFVHMMEEAAERLFEKNPLRFTADRYEAVCLRLLEAEEYESCEKWCLRQAKQYPGQLSSFTCRLKLYFTVRNREAFFCTLRNLQKSEVIVDHETLEMIRIFS